MKTTAISKPAQILTKYKTPQLLKSGLYLAWGTSALLLLTSIFGVQGQRHAIQTVGKDSAPSVLNAEQIKDALAGMDANAVNELLLRTGTDKRTIKDYQERSQAFAERMVLAAENITYDEERKPIRELQLESQNYIAKIEQAKYANARGDTNRAIAAYREAAKIMDEILLPAADQLAKVNLDRLEPTYNREQFNAGRSLFFLVISGLLLLGILVGIQLFLNYRMRRLLNPMLLGATAITLIFLGYATKTFLSSSNNLKVATKDSFVSLNALRKARSLAYIANAAESRYLLDKERANLHEQAFFTNVNQIAQIPNNLTYKNAANAIAQKQPVLGMTGFLADALNNITFDGERDAAVATLKTFDTYITIDGQIRQLARSGKYNEAIALCTGYNPGQSNWAFEEFKTAQNEFIKVNQKYFDDAIKSGFEEVNNFEAIASVATTLIATLTLFGLLPRIKEYER